MRYLIVFLIGTVFGCRMNLKDEQIFYPTGELKEKKVFIKDSNNYDFKSYYKDGKLDEQFSIRNNLIEGKTCKYSDSGVLLNAYTYNKGKLNGICQDFTIYGGLVKEYLYFDDKVKVYKEVYINKKEKDQICYAIYNNFNSSFVLNGELYIENNKIISDSSLYYFIRINDTFKIDEKIKVKIKAFSKGADCKMDVYIGKLDTNLTFIDTNVFHYKCSSLVDSFFLINCKIGYNLVLGKVVLSSNNKILREFILFDDFYINDK